MPHFQIKGYRPKLSSVAAIYQVGAPTILTQAMGCLMISSVNAILMPVSSTAVAFFGVYYKLQNFLMLPINGLGQAAIPIVGFNYGAKQHKRIRECLRILLPAAICIALVGTAIFEIFPSALLGMFSASDAMLSIGIPALRIIAVTFVFAAVTTVLGYVVSGLGNGVVNMLGTALRQFIILVPLVWLLSHFASINLTWYAIWASELIAVVYAALSTCQEFRKKVSS